MYDRIKRMQCRKALMILCQKKSGMISVVYKMPYDEKRVGCDETSGSLFERICVYRKFDESVKVFADYFILHPVRLRSLPHRYEL